MIGGCAWTAGCAAPAAGVAVPPVRVGYLDRVVCVVHGARAAALGWNLRRLAGSPRLFETLICECLTARPGPDGACISCARRVADWPLVRQLRVVNPDAARSAERALLAQRSRAA